jgi:hypothetical protein
MELYNRRQVLKGVSAGLAVAGVAATMPAGSASAAAAALVNDNRAVTGSAIKETAPAASFDGTAEPVVAYIHDASSGVISLFVGSREVTLHDTAIAAKLASAAKKEA